MEKSIFEQIEDLQESLEKSCPVETWEMIKALRDGRIKISEFTKLINEKSSKEGEGE